MKLFQTTINYLSFTLCSFLFINNAYAQNSCTEKSPYNLNISYHIQDNKLDYSISQKDNTSFNIVDLKYYQPYPTYLGLKIDDYPVNHNLKEPTFFTSETDKCASNILKIHQNYGVYTTALDSGHISQIFIYPLDDSYILKTTHLTGQVDIYNWIKKMKSILPANIHGKHHVKIEITLLHDKALTQESIFEIPATIDFDNPALH